jgi:hypothetical protein
MVKLMLPMIDYTKEVRIVRGLIDTEMTTKDELYEEYFDNPGYFYHHDDNVDEPNGMGLPFTASDSKYNWLTSGKIELVRTIPFKESRWWKKMEKKYEVSLAHLMAERMSLDIQISILENWLNNPTYEQQARSEEIANRER